MNNKRIFFSGLLLSIFLPGLLAACNQPLTAATYTNTTVQTTPVTIQQTKTTLQSLQDSENTMLSLSTIKVEGTESLINDQGSLPINQLIAEKIISNENLSTHSGTYQELFDITTGMQQQIHTHNGILTPDTAYVDDQDGQWYQSSVSTTTDQTFVANENFLQDFEQGQGSSIIDQGYVVKDGKTLHHIQIVFSTQYLPHDVEVQFQNTANYSTPPVSFRDVLNATTFSDLTADLWIDDTTSYLDTYQLSVVYAQDMSKWPGYSNVTEIIHRRLMETRDFSDFNQQPVKIAIPTNAQTVDDQSFEYRAS